MLGWGPPSSEPAVGWQSPDEPECLGVRETLGDAWRLTRSHLGPLATIAIIPEVVRNLLLLPLWLLYLGIYAKQIDFFLSLDFSRYADDPEGIQREMQAIYHVPLDQAIVVAICGGLSIVVWLVGFGAISSGVLAASQGTRPRVAGAWRSVAAHGASLVIPAVMLGLAWIVVGLPSILASNATAGGMDARDALTGALLSAAFVVIAIAGVFLIVRWAVIYQVILTDGHGFPWSLNKSAQLTAGARTRIGLIILAQWFILGIGVFVLSLITGFIGWLLTSSIEGTAMGYVVGMTICGFVYMPWVAAVLTHIHTIRTEATSDGVRPDPTS